MQSEQRGVDVSARSFLWACEQICTQLYGAWDDYEGTSLFYAAFKLMAVDPELLDEANRRFFAGIGEIPIPLGGLRDQGRTRTMDTVAERAPSFTGIGARRW